MAGNNNKGIIKFTNTKEINKDKLSDLIKIIII